MFFYKKAMTIPLLIKMIVAILLLVAVVYIIGAIFSPRMNESVGVLGGFW